MLLPEFIIFPFILHAAFCYHCSWVFKFLNILNASLAIVSQCHYFKIPQSLVPFHWGAYVIHKAHLLAHYHTAYWRGINIHVTHLQSLCRNTYGKLNIVSNQKYHYKFGLTFSNVLDLHRKNNLQVSREDYGNRTHKTYVNCEKLDETGARLEISPKNLSVSSPQNRHRTVVFASVCNNYG
jgi:hypothetical protein